MSFTLKSCLQRSFLMRLLQTTGLSLALMTASAIGVHAENVTVQGKDGANGFDNFDQGENAGSGGDGESVTASAGSAQPITSPLNTATASGGSGGNGGNNFAVPCCGFFGGFPGNGGSGGAAKATAATTILSGSAEADAAATGGSGGDGGQNPPNVEPSSGGGSGGTATASATGSSGSGSATTSATAKGGNGGFGVDQGGFGGDANASSTARTTGSGDALSSANAAAGAFGGSDDIRGSNGNATATADASAAGGGKAIATAVATVPSLIGLLQTSASATSDAVTVNGAMAQALSTVVGSEFEMQATSTAKTSLAGVSVQSTAAFVDGFSGTAMTDAIAQGRSGQTAVDPSETDAVIATVLPDKAYAATLIGGASNVADALLGPHDEIFGIAILGEEIGEEGITLGTASATFDFSFRGDLLLGVITGGFFSIVANGADILSEDIGDNSVINLGFLGPNIDLTIEGDGVFALGGAVPEPSTWAMMLLGFAGLGFAGYRSGGGRCSSRAFGT